MKKAKKIQKFFKKNKNYREDLSNKIHCNCLRGQKAIFKNKILNAYEASIQSE